LESYKYSVELNKIVLSKNETELLEAINTELKNPMFRAKQRKQLLDLQISKELKGTSNRIVQELVNL
jgi:hypothetical protein